jgi:2-methylaconitate cis-trans-isomerase PrpF
MNQTLHCVLMRAGTSRGPFFLKEWLPEDIALRDQVLIGAIGTADSTQIDGLGGGSTLTSKVAIVSRSSRQDCDVDYLFAQVGAHAVDTSPNCGNMLAGVAPFAVEQGLVAPHNGLTTVRVFNVNTNARIDVSVTTRNGQVVYDGDTRIDGVNTPAAPIFLSFLDAWGAVTGSVFPTGNRQDLIDGLPVTCIDAAMPMVLLRAADLGLLGTETAAELDARPGLLPRLELIRREAGVRMGLGDVSNLVIPKPVILSPHADALAVHSRYFTPKRCHTAHAVTGAVGVASALALPGTVAYRHPIPPGQHKLQVFHPSGVIQIQVEVEAAGDDYTIKRASVVRTARKIMEGELHIPPSLLTSKETS